jgi:hypothetical protein
LYATLTGDVPGIANAFVFLPLLCMNLAILLGCLIYLCWLSPLLLLGAIAFMGIGIVSHQLPVKKALKYFERAREKTDALFEHMRSLVEGTKELKLHYRFGTLPGPHPEPEEFAGPHRLHVDSHVHDGAVGVCVELRSGVDSGQRGHEKN